MYYLYKVISGGQTGADRAGLDAAKSFGINTGGYCPLNFKTEKGPDISLKDFGLKQTLSANPAFRTKLNVEKSNGTVVFSNSGLNVGIVGNGTKYTLKLLAEKRKPFIVNPDMYELSEWIIVNKIKILNVAGNRESGSPGIYKSSLKVLKGAFKILSSDNPDFNYDYLILKIKIKELCADNKSGSLMVLNNLIQALSEYLEKSVFESNVTKKHLQSAAKCLKSGKNTYMQSLQSFLNSFFLQCSSLMYNKKEILSYLKSYKRSWQAHNNLTIKRFIESVSLENKTILLLSNSAMIVHLFREILNYGIKVNVIQLLSVPENEGSLQFETLSNMGIKCSLINESIGKGFVGKSDFAILGCDSYNEKYFINKRGSYKISNEFHKAGKPVYVLTDSRKYKQKIETKQKKSDLFDVVPRKFVVLFD